MKTIIHLIILLHLSIIIYGQWSVLEPPAEKNYAIDFIDEHTGFIATKYNLFKSSDGGNSWTLMELPDAKPRKNEVVMIDENLIWCITDSSNAGGSYGGKLFKSEDGGSTWELKYQHNSDSFISMFFADEDHGWIGTGEYKIYRTSDGGENWSYTNQPMKQIWGIYFLNHDTGWICGYTWSDIYKTTDGGLTWQLQHDGPINEWLKDIVFVNNQKGFACGLDRTLLTTDNGGQTWEYIATTEEPGVLVGLPYDHSIYDIEFIDENKGWIVGGPC